MRHLAHCLILLMAPVAVHASDALSGNAHTGCSYSPSEVERIATPAAAVNLANSPSATVAKPATAHSGGGDDELMPRLRAPKWHRFLPGMFR
ncbi:MAG: hypothetical protein ACOH1V_05770 [Stenotrophomonas sp.]